MRTFDPGEGKSSFSAQWKKEAHESQGMGMSGSHAGDASSAKFVALLAHFKTV
jgi:hypothetical protein